MFEEEVGRGKKGEIHDTKDAYVKKKKEKKKKIRERETMGVVLK